MPTVIEADFEWGSAKAVSTNPAAEAGVMAKLSHSNIVTVFDAGVIEDEPFIAMDFIAGANLADWRKQR